MSGEGGEGGVEGLAGDVADVDAAEFGDGTVGGCGTFGSPAAGGCLGEGEHGHGEAACGIGAEVGVGIGDYEVGVVVDAEEVGVGHLGAYLHACLEFLAEVVALDLPVDGVGVDSFGVEQVFYPAFEFDEAECVARCRYCYRVDRGGHVYDAFAAAVFFLYFVEVDDGG